MTHPLFLDPSKGIPTPRDMPPSGMGRPLRAIWFEGYPWVSRSILAPDFLKESVRRTYVRGNDPGFSLISQPALVSNMADRFQTGTGKSGGPYAGVFSAAPWTLGAMRHGG